MCSTSEGRKSVFAILVGASMLLSVPSSAWGEAPLKVTIDANTVSVRSGPAPLLHYSYGDVPFKPYVKELYTPNGLNVLRDAPHDHLHHHGLMFALAVDGVDFWSETPECGRQMHAGFEDVVVRERGEAPGTGFAEQLCWTSPSDKKPLRERRSIYVYQTAEPEATMLLWESRLSRNIDRGSKGVLTGAHYFGLGMRFIEAMDKNGTFCNADDRPGTVFRGQEKLVRSNWCAYTAQADGKDVTVAMFGHPDNPRVSTTWFTMTEPFAYLAATLGLHEEPIKLTHGPSMRLRYGVALCDGAVEPEKIDLLYQQWLRSVSN